MADIRVGMPGLAALGNGGDGGCVMRQGGIPVRAGVGRRQSAGGEETCRTALAPDISPGSASGVRLLRAAGSTHLPARKPLSDQGAAGHFDGGQRVNVITPHATKRNCSIQE